MRRLASEHEISEWVTTGGLFPDWSVLASGETGKAVQRWQDKDSKPSENSQE